MRERLQVTAHLRGMVALPSGSLALDALLMAATALRDNLPPILDGDPADIDIPVEKSACGRVHLASFAVPAFESHENHWVNRRFPVEQAQALGGPKVRSINLAGGPTKSYRLPLEVGHLEHDRADWYCVGDREAVADLLQLVTHLGKRRGVGKGAVERWTLAPHEGWEGFPVVREGKPLRPLPLDWPGLVEPEVAICGMTPPYWHHSRRQECAVPEGFV